MGSLMLPSSLWKMLLGEILYHIILISPPLSIIVGINLGYSLKLKINTLARS